MSCLVSRSIICIFPGEIPDNVCLVENNDIEFDANAALPEVDGLASDDSNMTTSGSEDESESDDEDNSDEEGAKFGDVRYKGEFAGSTNQWNNNKKNKKKK